MPEELDGGVLEESGDETAYLLRSEEMRRRLLAAMERQDGMGIEEVVERLGLEEG
ncbi:MAG: hypothetical protein IPJ98_26510 [Bryobacterales bacterium]|nr:hypothetical protein [Bryobacterales bacterium]